MKYKLLLAGAVLFGSILPGTAARLTPEQALQRLQSTKSIKSLKGKLPVNPQYDSTIGNLYVFSSGDGYMILPDNDESPALLAFSENGKFSTTCNPGLSYWLEFYNRELSSISSKDNSTKLTSIKAASRPTREAIAPLTKTKWNQEAPYNDLCPEVDGKRTVTGCVATAMAQIMKYHNYPSKGKGQHSYTWETGGKDLSCDFATTTFEWTKMTDTYNDDSTEDSKTAVATLMSACGISVDMDYGVDESSASSVLMAESLVDYFDYDSGLWIPMRDFYGIYDWEDMIYSDLAEGLPVLYSGQGTAGGHQFICDGYSGDGYFHFNWGWGGMSDGYFLLTALNPASLGVGGGAGGFNSNQMVTLGVQPPKGDSKYNYTMYNYQSFVPSVTQVTGGTALECSGEFMNFSIAALPSGSYIGMKITPSDGSDPQFVRGFAIDGLPVSSYYDVDRIVFPSLTDGSYVITPAFYDGTQWKEIPSPLGMTGKINAQVSDNVATLSTPSVADIEVSDITVPSTIYIGTEFPMSFVVTNPNSEEYVGKVIPLLFSESGQEVAQSVYRPVDILGEGEESVTDYIGKFQTVGSATLTAGNYILVFFDESGNQISGETSVTLQEAPAETKITVSDLKLLSPDPVIDSSNVKFSFDVTCSEGYFSGELRLFIFPASGGMSLLGNPSEHLFLNGGDAKTVEMSMNLSTLSAGEYMAVLYNGSTELTSPVYFTISEIATGVIEIEDPSAESLIIYNLQGIKCHEPLSPGFYIINGKKTLVR